MRKILFYTVLCFFYNSYVYADYQIDFQLDKNEVVLWEQFIANLTITNFWDVVVKKIDLDGLSDFQLLWKSQQSEVSIKNEVLQTQMQIQFILSPKKVWEFKVWPLKIELWKDSVIDVEWKDIKVVDWWESSLQGNLEEDNLENTDLYWEKWPENHMVLSSKTGVILLVILFFIFFFYFLSKYLPIFSPLPKKLSLPQEKTVEKDNSYFLNLLHHLKKQQHSMNRSDFFAQFNDILRKYLSFLGLQWSETITQKELLSYQKNPDFSHIIDIFKISYTWEFSNIEDMKIREQCIDTFDKILRKI